MLRYADDAATIASVSADDLAPFFEEWSSPPPGERRLAALRGADRAVLVFDANRLVGFVTAVTDRAMVAYLPLLEVLPGHQGQGIGTELVRRAIAALGPMYGVDACCDEDVVPFFERLGFGRVAGMVRRDPNALG